MDQHFDSLPASLYEAHRVRGIDSRRLHGDLTRIERIAAPAMH
jgi:hypothetical protein